jgi:NuA3 HAT complex component NTO1
MRERKRLAKRIIKMVQPQLESAVRVEADISGLPTETSLKELERLIEASSQPLHDSGAGSKSFGDTAIDIEMADQSQHNGASHTNGDGSTEHGENKKLDDGLETADIEMEDADAPHEEDAVVVDNSESIDAVTTGDTLSTTALAEVNGNISPMKNGHVNGIKNESISPTTNGYTQAVENEQPGPPTPPVSNGDISNDAGSKILTDGGIPHFLLQSFRINGTQISDSEGLLANAVTEALGDADDELNGIDEAEGEVVAVGGRGSPVKTKKGKAKKRKFGSKAR